MCYCTPAACCLSACPALRPEPGGFYGVGGSGASPLDKMFVESDGDWNLLSLLVGAIPASSSSSLSFEAPQHF